MPIQDKESNVASGIADGETCKNAVDFALKFFPDQKFSQPKFRHLYNALAEMMLNTDNHAYDDEYELRNWYLFAIKVEKGVAFYFFDNGKGILRTAKQHLLERLSAKADFSYGYISLMKAALNGEYRSATGESYRNKGLPEINEFFNESTVSYPLIITNKVYCAPQQGVYKTNQYNFRGTLFVWLLKDEE
jgi:hypothetical protein